MDKSVLSPLIPPLSVLVSVNFQRCHMEVEFSLLNKGRGHRWCL